MTRSPPPDKVTASLKVTVTLMSSPAPYKPSAVVEVTEVIVGAVVSTTRAEPESRSVAGTKSLTALPAASASVPAVKAIEFTVRSVLVSPAWTV